jgi:A/G-specific adenine glycosylase
MSSGEDCVSLIESNDTSHKQSGEPLRHEKEFYNDLLTWELEHGRVFPWRTTTDPFHILIAEMMLRRTQARQVAKVYISFTGKYLDAKALADAPSDEIAGELYSLGLAWRVPAFQTLARILVDQYDGKVPGDYDTLSELPGVGDYVASAVCCFAFGKPVILADTNTVRVVGRIYDIPTNPESRRKKPVRQILEALLYRQEPRLYNYALLDLASLICTPTDPSCEICPVLRYCKTGQKRTGEQDK